MNDELMHYNHNHDKLGRFARSTGAAASSVGSATTRKLKSNKRIAKKSGDSPEKVKVRKANEVIANNKKKKGSKSNNTKLSDKERKRLVEHGSAKEITKNKDRLSNRELESAITRLQKEQNTRAVLEKKLSDINNPSKKEAKSLVDKMSDAGVKLGKATDAVDKAVKAYNLAAKIHNTTSDEKWPVVGENNDKNKILKMQKVVMTGSAADVWANRANMTPQQYENAKKRIANDEYIKTAMEKEHKNNITVNMYSDEKYKNKKNKSYYYDSKGKKYTWYG